MPRPDHDATPRPDALVARLRAAGCVFAEGEARLLRAAAGRDGAELDALVLRRVAGEPLEQVVGWAEFAGLRVALRPRVFVPRRRTEFLVECAVALLASRRSPAIVVDLCCGSGAIGAAVAATAAGVALHAADIDPRAVDCARGNIARYGGRAYLGDLTAPLPAELRGHVSVLTANVPYVPSGEVPLLPAEAREHEPLVALDGGSDGLDLLRRVAAEAADWLAPGGHLLSETSDRQSDAALAVLRAAGLRAALAVDDERGATVVIGTNAAGDPVSALGAR